MLSKLAILGRYFHSVTLGLSNMEWFKRKGITKPILSRKAGNTYTLLSERKRFRSSLDYEKSRSDIVTVSENDNWFISLGQSVSELKLSEQHG